MSLVAIDPVSIRAIALPETNAQQLGPNAPSFMQMLGSAVDGLNGSLNDADASARALAAGQDVPVQDVMIAMESAHLRLQFAVEIRNRLVDAYQNLTNMQL